MNFFLCRAETTKIDTLEVFYSRALSFRHQEVGMPYSDYPIPILLRFSSIREINPKMSGAVA